MSWSGYPLGTGQHPRVEWHSSVALESYRKCTAGHVKVPGQHVFLKAGASCAGSARWCGPRSQGGVVLLTGGWSHQILTHHRTMSNRYSKLIHLSMRVTGPSPGDVTQGGTL